MHNHTCCEGSAGSFQDKEATDASAGCYSCFSCSPGGLCGRMRKRVPLTILNPAELIIELLVTPSLSRSDSILTLHIAEVSGEGPPQP